jgi:GDPmannose 4,6-dehydratase
MALEANRRNWKAWGIVAPGASPAEVEALADASGTTLIETDLADVDACRRLIADTSPDIVFHLAALSSVGQSWTDPLGTAQINAMATLALMTECWDLTNRSGKPVRFVNASSAEIFAGTSDIPQSENTALEPLSPYGATKAFAHMMAGVFRSRGLHVSNAILYGHESPLRPKTFVSRKISAGVAAIASGERRKLTLGNLDARRDWGWAPDYVDCLVRIALHDTATDFVVATGKSHSVREFVSTAFSVVGVDDWEAYVEVDRSLLRPTDSVELVGDPSRARSELGWQPTKTFQQMAAAMVHHDLNIRRSARL